MLRLTLGLLLVVILTYALLTSYAGFRVARGIDDAKAQSVATRVGARIIGRDAVERLAIRKGNVPGWITQSPTFWMALRANE
jgi:hypothetical protein